MKQWIYFYILVFSLFFGTPNFVQAVSGAPSDDATFYLSAYSEKHSIGFLDFPSEDLGLDKSMHGFFISNGQVMQEPNQKHSWGNCDTPLGFVCTTKRTVEGTYSGGHLEITVRSDTSVVYNGAPVTGNTPVVPGTVKLFSEMKIEGDFDDENLMRFQGKVKKKSATTPDWSCAKWDPKYGEGGICMLDKYTSKPVETLDFSWTGFVAAPKSGYAVVYKLSGDVEISKGGGKNFVPAKIGDILKKGDFISTGFDSRASVDFGYGQLDVGKMTQLRIDEFTDKDNLKKTQLFLQIGSVQAKVKHTNSGRSDFSVVTPTANSSIRGSAMVVSYDEKSKKTDVLVTEDKAYVKGLKDGVEVEVLEGKKVVVDESQKVSKSESFSSSDLPSGVEMPQNNMGSAAVSKYISSSWLMYGGAGVVMIILLVLFLKKRKQ